MGRDFIGEIGSHDYEGQKVTSEVVCKYSTKKFAIISQFKSSFLGTRDTGGWKEQDLQS